MYHTAQSPWNLQLLPGSSLRVRKPPIELASPSLHILLGLVEVFEHVAPRTGQREWHAACFSAEDVNGTILMPTGNEPAIRRLEVLAEDMMGDSSKTYQVDTSTKTALGLVVSDLSPVRT